MHTSQLFHRLFVMLNILCFLIYSDCIMCESIFQDPPPYNLFPVLFIQVISAFHLILIKCLKILQVGIFGDHK